MKWLSMWHRDMHATLMHTWTNMWLFHMIAQFMMIYCLGGVYVQYSAHRMLLVIQEHHACNLFTTEKSFVSVRRTSCPPISCCAFNLLTFSMRAKVNLGVFLFSFRTSLMTKQRWSSMWTLLMVWWWRATCSRGPAMPLRLGTGERNCKNLYIQ